MILMVFNIHGISPLTSAGFPCQILIIYVCSFQSQVASRVSTGFGHGVDYSIEDTDNGCLDAEGDDVRRQRSFDGRVSTCCTSSL